MRVAPEPVAPESVSVYQTMPEERLEDLFRRKYDKRAPHIERVRRHAESLMSGAILATVLQIVASLLVIAEPPGPLDTNHTLRYVSEGLRDHPGFTIMLLVGIAGTVLIYEVFERSSVSKLFNGIICGPCIFCGGVGLFMFPYQAEGGDFWHTVMAFFFIGGVYLHIMAQTFWFTAGQESRKSMDFSIPILGQVGIPLSMVQSIVTLTGIAGAILFYIFASLHHNSGYSSQKWIAAIMEWTSVYSAIFLYALTPFYTKDVIERILNQEMRKALKHKHK